MGSDEVQCPYCGYIQEDDECNLTESGFYPCEQCGQQYYLSIDIITCYNTAKTRDED